MAHINELDDEGDIPARIEVAVHKLSPALFLLLLAFRVAVAGQIDEVNAIALKEIDGYRLAWHGADPRQILAVKDLVYERGFADI